MQDQPLQTQIQDRLQQNDLLQASCILLSLPFDDTYTYHAVTSVQLPQVQHVVSLGGVNGLHAWYRNEDDSFVSLQIRCYSRHASTDKSYKREAPPPTDIEAYISIFSPSTATASAIKNFSTNAKKDSIRVECANHLLSKRYVHPALTTKLAVPKSKSPPYNPYFTFWQWSCRSLEWCGPCPSSERVMTSHHVLPIFMHHFGCATPSHESLEILKSLADGRSVADIGSGNGYWTHMLRAYGLTAHPVDNMQSEWRVKWINDTTIADGVKWLRKNNNGKDMVLLLVYPVVGGGIGGGKEGGFTRDLVSAYKGDTIAVVGTQNGNGYTGFKSMTMDKFMEVEHSEWTKVVQIPLPSFAGKDEALFVFQRETPAP